MQLNNIRLKHKFLILFAICVLLPLVSTTVFLMEAMGSAANADARRRLENLSDKVEYDISMQIGNVVSVADYFYTDIRVHEFLNERYSSAQDYYNEYLKLMDSNVIQNFQSAQIVKNVVICVDNDTLVNGNFFVKKEELKDSSWYQAFEKSGVQRLLYVFFEDGRNSKGYVSQGRHIVLLQKMDYFSGKDVMLLDIDEQKLFETAWLEGTSLCMYDDEKILFSTQEAEAQKENFQPVATFPEGSMYFEKELQNYGASWVMRLSGKKYNIFTVVGDHAWQVVALYVFNLLIPAVFMMFLYRSFKQRILLLNDNMVQVRKGHYQEIAGDGGRDELGSMILTYDLMIRKIKELIEVDFKNREKQQSLEISKKQAELAALQSQINPHFMFNALESIRMHSILKNETETAKILENFAVLMRKNIQWNKDFVTIDEEMDNVRRYLQIQQYRFGERLQFSVYVQDECMSLEIPKFVIITFVENACVHGIEDSVTGGSVTVFVSLDGDYVFFEIMDSGSGMDEEELAALQEKVDHASIKDIQQAHKSIGILNAVVRMRQYYGKDVVIDVNSTKGEGTEICIRLPKEFHI